MSDRKAGSPPPSARAAATVPGGRRPNFWRRRSRWFRRLVVGGALGVLVLLVAVFAAVYLAVRVPLPRQVASAQTTVVYYSDGKTELSRLAAENRTDIPLSSVPVPVREAVLAAEDHNFYHEPGISPRGILRALWTDIRGGEVSQGGSTITQQYVKNAYLTSQRTFSRKIKEIVLAVKLDHKYSKDQILDFYLNTIYFGRQAYGIEAASHAYFGESASQLTPAQGALLAGLIRSPSTLDPAHDKAASEQRWHQVIDTMAAQKWLTPAQAATIRFPATQDPALAQLNVNLSPNGHYIQDRVIAELEAAGFSEDGIMRGGYRVMTSISPSYQNELEQAVQSSMPAGTAPTVHEGAEAIEPGTGRVLAYYAGSEYSGAQSKDAVHYLRANPGSTMKAITLATALANGYSLNSTYDSRSPLVIPGYYPPSNPLRNAEPSSGGPVTLTTATAESVNTVFVPLAMDVGVDKVQAMAERLGIDPSAWAGGGVGPSITLGASPKGIRVEDMATVYATLAAQGVRAHTHFVDTVLDPAGTVVYRANPNAHQVVGRDVMADTTYALEQVFKYGTASRGRIYGRPTAGKTGTVEDNKGAWFCGYVPQISLAVGVFNDPPGQVPPIPGYEGSQTRLFGSTIPLTIWRKFMVSATAGLPVKDFPPPAYVGSVKHRAYVPVPKPTPSATATPTPGVPTPGPTPAPTGPAATPTPKAVPTQPTKTKRPTPPAKHATRSPKP